MLDIEQAVCMKAKLLVTALGYSCTSGSLHALGDGRSLLRLSRCHDEAVDEVGGVE